MKAESILIFIFMSLTVLNLNSCKYRANFTETLAAQDTKSTLVSQEYFEISPLNGHEATPEELSSFAKQIRTYDLNNNNDYFELTTPISPLAVGLVVYQPLKDLNPLQINSVVKAQLIKIQEINGTTEKTFKISDSLYFKSTLPTYLHIGDSGINKYDAQKQKIDALLPNAKCYLKLSLFTTRGACQDISFFFKSNFENPGIFLVDVPALGVRTVKGIPQYNKKNELTHIQDPDTGLKYQTTSRKIVAFYTVEVPKLETTPPTDLKSNEEIKTNDAVDQDLEKKSSRFRDSQWLRGSVDFMIGPYLIVQSHVYHNATQRGFKPTLVDVLGFRNAQVKIRIKSSGVIKFADRDTIYIHRKNTTLGREQEIFNDFLTQCRNTDSTGCYVKKDLVSLLNNSSLKEKETKEFIDFPMPSRITSITGVWLINVGLGYEIIKGSTAKVGRTLQINTLSGTVYNLSNKNILAYFVTSSSAGKWLRGRKDFNVGKHLIGKSGIYHNTEIKTFAPKAVNFIGVRGSLAIIVVHGEKELKIVNPTALYIQRENTTLGREQEILDEFLTQCKSNMATNCYLKKGIKSSSNKIETDLKIQNFDALPIIEKNSATKVGFWLVDMGLGYEIIEGDATKTANYLKIATTTGTVYILREGELIGYFLKG